MVTALKCTQQYTAAAARNSIPFSRMIAHRPVAFVILLFAVVSVDRDTAQHMSKEFSVCLNPPPPTFSLTYFSFFFYSFNRHTRRTKSFIIRI